MYFDIAMPLTLFFVTLASMLLSEKTESKLKSVFEKREFALRDSILLATLIVVMVSLIVWVPQMGLMILYLFSYSMLLFVFTYLFSNKRWYLAIVPSAVFVLLYIFFKDTPIWFDYLFNFLFNVYGVIFAILITLYIGSLFTWKTTIIFTCLLTVMDTILVLVTGTTVDVAKKTIGLRLPVAIVIPIVPLIVTEGGVGITLLGLGDFLFAGLLAIQTFKKYGKKFALLSIMAMTVSFFIFEAFLPTYQSGAFPGTVMIICGWLPLALWKRLKH